MAIYLAEDQVGFDTSLIGFPTLGGCMGLAVQTTAGLYGFHNPPGHNARSTEFAKLYIGQPATCLVSCSRWKNRYNNATGEGSTQFISWVNEIGEIADLMKFTGPVIGINLSATLGVIDVKDSAYCEYVLSSTGVLSTGFSLTSNTSPSTTYDLGTSVRRIDAKKNSSVPYKGYIFDDISSSNGGFTISDGKSGVYQVTI